MPASELLKAGLYELIVKLLNSSNFSSFEIVNEVTWIIINLSEHENAFKDKKHYLIQVLF